MKKEYDMTSNKELERQYRQYYRSSLNQAKAYDSQREDVLKQIEKLESANKKLYVQLTNIQNIKSNDFSRLIKLDESQFKGTIQQNFFTKVKEAESKLEAYKSAHEENKSKISAKIKSLQDQAASLQRKSTMAYIEAESYLSLAYSMM